MQSSISALSPGFGLIDFFSITHHLSWRSNRLKRITEQTGVFIFGVCLWIVLDYALNLSTKRAVEVSLIAICLLSSVSPLLAMLRALVARLGERGANKKTNSVAPESAATAVTAFIAGCAWYLCFSLPGIALVLFTEDWRYVRITSLIGGNAVTVIVALVASAAAFLILIRSVRRIHISGRSL